jgi:TolB protein
VPAPTPTPSFRLPGTPRPIPSPTPSPTPAPVPTATVFAGPAVDRIAFVGPDNHIYTIASDGSARRRITPPPANPDGPAAAYSWPTWSPDAQSLLLSAAVPDPGYPGGRLVVYYTSETSPDSGLVAIHQDGRGSEGILPGVYHYAMWSPDSKRVAIIAVGLDDLAVFVAGLDGAPARPIIGGAPMYVTWSWDSQRMYVHQQSRLMMFTPSSAGVGRTLGISGRYQAPMAATSPGGRLAYVMDGPDGIGDVVISDADGTNREAVVQVTGVAAVQWSPDGRRLAIGLTVGGDERNYGQVLIAEVASTEVVTAVQGPIFSFEWSPDARQLLFAQHATDDAGLLRWSVLDIDDGAIIPIVDLRPTPEFGLRLVYFDQYAQSHRLWAPDGRHFVLAGQLQDAQTGTPVGPAEQVWIVDATGADVPRAIAEGYLAFWSPQ